MGHAHSGIRHCETMAYQITKVEKHSPGEDCGLCVKVDFILSMNGVEISNKNSTKFLHIIKVNFFEIH